MLELGFSQWRQDAGDRLNGAGIAYIKHHTNFAGRIMDLVFLMRDGDPDDGFDGIGTGYVVLSMWKDAENEIYFEE
jgi:hypothetical protein